MSPAQGKIPSTGIFCQNSISPVQWQSPTHQGTMKIFKVSTHHTVQSPHTGELWKISKSPHTRELGKFSKSLPTTEPIHQSTLKIFKAPTHSTEPTHQRTLKIFQGPNTQHRAHTQGDFKNFQSTHTPRNFENFEVSTHHNTEPTTGILFSL